MAKKSITYDLKGVKKALDGLKPGMIIALEHTASDCKAKIPPIVTKAVTSMYNIKASEVRPATKKDAENNVKKVGSMWVSGRTISSVTVTYTGRQLTHTHFSMTPKRPTAHGPYTIMASVYKGSPKRIGGRKEYTSEQKLNVGRNFHKQGRRSGRVPTSPFFMRTGNKKLSGTDFIPFQRVKSQRTGAKVFRPLQTTSLPQMVQNKQVSETIGNNIDEMVVKRLKHNIKRNTAAKKVL